MNLLSILAKLFRVTPAPAPERPPDTPAKAVPTRHRKVQSCSNAVTVESFYPATGKTVKRYPSIGSAASDGFDYAKVQVASLYGGIHKGLGWRRVKRDDISAASSRPSTPPPARAETPDVASVLLTDALRRDELARLRKDVFFDENRHEWGVRLKGRTLHRPERHEVVRIWYDTPEQERRPGDESIQGPPPAAPPAQAAVPKQRLSYKKFTRLEAFDPQTGRTVRVFNSIQDAVRQGFNESGIYAARNHCLKTYKGYGWRVNTTLSKPVEARCPATGGIVFVFRTVEDIQARDYKIDRIEHAITHGNTYAHLHWRYAGNGETAPETSVEKVTPC